jgi:multicomponent K+:H+ antiporter subunit E
MKRWLPYPLLTLALLAMWLLLNQSLAPGQLLLGVAVAMIGCAAMASLKPDKARLRSLRPIPRRAAAVLTDVVRSNIAVASIVLFPWETRVSSFVLVPLDMTDRYGLTILACIITATPGTCWAQFDPRTNRLLVHVLDLVDEERWIRLIKRRYERPLMEIFE